MVNTVIKVTLAVLFFLCLADLPYGFYQFVRFAAMVGFAFLSYNAYEDKSKNEAIIYASLAILFQPFLKIALGRELWNVVDVLVGLGLVVSLLMRQKQTKR